MMERLGVRAAEGAPAYVDVMVRCTGPDVIGELRQAGMRVRSVTTGTYAVASGTVQLAVVEQIGDVPGVRRVEVARELVNELDVSCHEANVAALHGAMPPVLGEGALIGIIDGGIDYTHPDFCHAPGSSRILYLWDQQAPAGDEGVLWFDYGQEFSKSRLDAALTTSTLVHLDERAHGTHVAGIAAGNGSSSGGKFTGVAPRADLIVVKLDRGGEKKITLGRSDRAMDAFVYIVTRARELNRPVAINFSQGMNGGGHSGETALETTLDNLLREPGVVIVKSAGNEQEWRSHAGGDLSRGQTVELLFEVESNNVNDDIIEVWFDGRDAISVSLQPPHSAPLDFVPPGVSAKFDTPAGNRISVRSRLDEDETGDTMVSIIMERGGAIFIQPGTWKLRLRADAVEVGRYDAWIERTNRAFLGQQARFAAASADPTRTISIPGTTRRVITVGSYVVRPAEQGGSLPLGHVSSFSSRGPTRYGAQKPDIAAPGEEIIAARSQHSDATAKPDQWYTAVSGTSMAAPHVTAVAALILAARPGLTCEQVKQLLTWSARRDGLAAVAPDNAWGYGKLDAAVAYEAALKLPFPSIADVVVSGDTISWKTDLPTTSTVRFHSELRHLQLLKNVHSLSDLTYGTTHTLTVAGVPAGTYFCEILAFSSYNLWTSDDNQGAFYEVTLP